MEYSKQLPYPSYEPYTEINMQGYCSEILLLPLLDQFDGFFGEAFA